MMKNRIKTYMFISTLILAIASCNKEDIKPNINDAVNQNKNATVSNGQGGSLAQFTIINDYLYTVDYKSVKVFDLSNPANPSLITSVDLGVGIETIHAQDNYLFIGTNSGVTIMNATTPTELVEESRFEHVTSCDPVVTNNNIAVSTLRGGTDCGGTTNEFDVIDISDISNPELITNIELDGPYGLSFSKTNTKLVYICDGASGLKAFDLTDLDNIELVMELNVGMAKDIIVTDQQTIIVLSSNGIYQYDASNELNLIEKSVINISL